MDSTVNLPDPNASADPSIGPSAADALLSPRADVALWKEAFPSTRIRPQEWEKHRSLIENMHASDNSMKEIKTYMELTHGFFASDSQWKKKLSQWNLRRNLGKGVARFVGKRALRRRNEQQKETEFRYKGLPQPVEKVERHVKELKKCIENGDAPSPTEVTPEGMSYHTIPSPGLSVLALPHSRDHRDAANMPPAASIGPLRMVFYNGKGVDQWRLIADQAVSLAGEGDYFQAKATLLSSLDALEALLGPDDTLTTDLLTEFVESAVEHEDLVEAASRLHKSYRNHCDNLGQTHVRTWQSLIRLGTFYMDAGKEGEAYHMLFNARQGLLAVFKDEPEQALSYTQRVTRDIVEILINQRDFLAAEGEIKMGMQRAKAAGDLHESTLHLFQHELAHLYNNETWHCLAAEGKLPHPTLNGVEAILLDDLSLTAKLKGLVTCFTNIPCSLEQLRLFYERTLQHEKLPALLTQIEDYITESMGKFTVSEAEFKHTLNNIRGVAFSYKTLKNYERAEMWLLRRREQINMAPAMGPTSSAALTNQMLLVEIYYEQQMLNEEREALKQAQLLAHELLPVDHDFHTYVADILRGVRIRGKRCVNCLIERAVHPYPDGPPKIKLLL